MKITRVTITGADNDVLTHKLEELSKKFPFVEWGILFSSSKVGKQRYPDDAWIKRLLNHDVRLSAHFCGWYSRQVIEAANYDVIEELHPKFGRVQLNYSFGTHTSFDKYKFIQYANTHINRDYIFQSNEKNWSTVDKLVTFYGNVPTIHVLYDESGGRGVEMKTIQSPCINNYTGYSGGIGPENIDKIIKGIVFHPNQSEVWIDMEGAVRTNNNFDLDKVEYILERCAPHVTIK